MPALALLTEADLGQFVLDELGPLATDLGWTAPTDVLAAVEDAIYSYFDGDGALADVTDQRKLRALARVEAWRMAVNATSADFDSSTDGQSLSLAQRHAQAVGRLADARARAAEYRKSYAITISNIPFANDPFAPRTGTEFA